MAHPVKKAISEKSKYKSIAGQIAGSSVFRENPNDPVALSVFKSSVGWGAIGGSYFGPIGSLVGGGAGIFNGMLSAVWAEDRRREARRQRLERLATARSGQLSQLRDSLFTDIRSRKRFKNIQFQEEVDKVLRGDFSRVDGGHRTNKVLSKYLRQTTSVSAKSKADQINEQIALRENVYSKAEKWQMDIIKSPSNAIENRLKRELDDLQAE